MDNIYLYAFMVLLAAYIGVLVSVGWYFNKKQRSVTDFWLAGRKVGAIPIGFSAAASWITAGGLLSVIALYMVLGTGSIWEFAAPNFIALFIIGLLVSKIKSLPSITQPELLEQRYSGMIRAPVAIIVMIVMMLFAAADVSGLSLVFGMFFGLSPVYAAVLIGVCVSVYVLLGGLSAVVWTDVMQFLLLISVLIFGAVGVVGYATGLFGDLATTTTLSDLFFNSDLSAKDWWNPASIGLWSVLVFCVAIIPGWFMEHDQWQKVWAAKDEKSARNGFFFGSFLMFMAFGVFCCITAIGLRFIYPDALVSVPAAEVALLEFFNRFSAPVVLLLALGLTAAAMSCTDTFATSGGSCISRDLYQRYVKPDATMKQMKTVNRVSVVIIVIGAVTFSFMPVNIIDYIHIATYIATAAYFFPLMGGLYWKRATKEGAMASLVVGAVVQILMCAYDVVLAQSGSSIAAIVSGVAGETVGSLFVCHGVLIGMTLSLIAFVGVSLMTPAPSKANLAPFFPEEAAGLVRDELSGVDTASADYKSYEAALLSEETGERMQMQLELTADKEIDWNKFVTLLKEGHGNVWIAPAGKDSLYRLTHSDMLSCPRITRGKTETEIWIAAEPRVDDRRVGETEVFIAYNEVKETLAAMNLNVS